VGPGVEPAKIPQGTGLDDIAPTLAETISLERKFPEVRSGTAVDEVVPGTRPGLLVVVAIKGIGTADLEAGGWPTLERALEEGAGTSKGTTASLPVDPAAAISTIGTGGLPSQHGMTGEIVRNDDGDLVRAWGQGSPVSVIAALGDDLDELMGQEPLIGLAGSQIFDRGLIGGDWYVDVDRDTVRMTDDPAAAVSEMLERGFGDDEVPDLLGVALDGSRPKADGELRGVLEAAAAASGDRYLAAIAGTGAMDAPAPSVPARRIVREVEESVPGPTRVIEAAGAGGLFLDQDGLVDTGLSEDAVIGPLKEISDGGDPLIVDAFPAIAVSFSKYC
jgi:hypothetical protein